MEKRTGKKTAKRPKSKKAYLTKRGLIRAATPAIRRAARKTLKNMGHTIIYKDGWIIDVDKEGNVKQLKEVKKIEAELDLD